MISKYIFNVSLLLTDLHFVRNEDKLVLGWIFLIHDLFASRKVLEIREPIQSLLYLPPPPISSFILLFDGCPLYRFAIYLSIVLSFLLPRLLLFTLKVLIQSQYTSILSRFPQDWCLTFDSSYVKLNERNLSLTILYVNVLLKCDTSTFIFHLLNNFPMQFILLNEFFLKNLIACYIFIRYHPNKTCMQAVFRIATHHLLEESCTTSTDFSQGGSPQQPWPNWPSEAKSLF